MSNGNAPKQKRSFKVIGKIFRFVVAMVLTFIISFVVTLVIKSEHPADLLGTVNDQIISENSPKSSTAPEIKTLFDERNNQPFDPTKYDDTSIVKGQRSEVAENFPAADELPTVRHTETGFFAALNRMTSIEPAVNEKISDIPHYVPINDIPYIMCQAIVSVEDVRFYKHRGFDLIGIARATLVNVEAGEIREGGSTITQQTVKNLFLTSDRTLARKAEELILSRSLEKNFDKDKILEIYLNSIYFGSNFYGIYDAAQGYFGKEPADLTIAECAMLAGLPNAPSLNSPYVDFRRAKQRQLIVIDALEKLGIITKREAENARIEEIILAH